MAGIASSTSSAIAEYYRHPAVRRRIREYCGLDPDSAASCVLLSATLPDSPPPAGWRLDPRFPTTSLDELLDRGADLYRSVWDRGSLLVYIDIDYLNAELAGHAFARPHDVFSKVEPTYAAVLELLRDYGLGLLALMTGRGYQFVGRVPRDSPLVERLAALAPGLPDWYEPHPARLPSWITDRLTPELARAYIGTGLIFEHFAHLVIRRTCHVSSIPLVVNGTRVGLGPGGREAMSLDLSFAGDPLDVRHMRVAFGGYQVHRFRADIYGPEVSHLEPLVTVPRGEVPLEEMLREQRAPEGAVRLADSSSARIPIVSNGLAALTADYEQSPLATVHASFYATEPHGPSAWSDTYDRFDVQSLPPCVADPLLQPNDRLLKPEHLQHVTRFLLSEGWTPRHIAGLVWSRYARDFGWGDRWTQLSPFSRADFDVRVFAGMVMTGLDRGVDFNCRSAQEKQLCPAADCSHDLRVARDRLLSRVDGA